MPVSIKEVPFFRLIIPLLLGIASQYWLNLLPFSLWNYSVVLFLLALTLISFLMASHWRFRWIFGCSINLFLFFFGAIITIKQPISDKLVVGRSNNAIIYLLDNPQVRTKSVRVEAEVRFLNANYSWWSTNEKMLVYFDLKDTLASNLCYGSLLAVNFVPQPVPAPGNPNQFDFKKYLSDRGVNYTAYIKPEGWVHIGNDGLAIKKKALLLRDKLVLLFKSFGLSGNELAVASALTLGYQDLLDDELRQVYSSSGAMHILSVSGLHVGILYVLLSFLLSFLNRNTLARALKALVLLSFLWFFALLTGLPPCVQRSALMFSFLVVSDFFKRKSNIYNTLAASAFVLLVINPYNLLDVGFQLSYLAVISIVFFYPYIYKLIYVKNWALDKIWSLVAVSIAAQFGTFSISLFYFNQFPNYFLLANLIAIPLSTIALYLSVLLILVSPFNIIANFVGKVFSISVSMLNHGLEYVEKLPYSVSDGIHITALQMFIILGATITLSIYLTTKRYKYIFIALSLFIVFLGLNLGSYIKKEKSKEFIVFNINKKSLIGFRVSNDVLFIDEDSSRNQFTDKYNFFIKGYLSSMGAIRDYKVIRPQFNEMIRNQSFEIKHRQGVSIINFINKTIVIPFNKTLDKYSSNHRLSVDYLIINRNYPVRIFDFFQPKMVIIDSSVPKNELADILLKCKLEDQPYYVTSLQGAFSLKENQE